VAYLAGVASVSKRRVRALLLGLLLAAGLVTSAAAEDCYPKLIAAAVHPAPVRHAPARPAAAHRRRLHRARPAHHALKPRPARHAPARATVLPSASHRRWMESSAARRTIPVYVARPAACDLHPAALLESPAPVP